MDAKTMGERLLGNRMFIQPYSITPQMTYWLQREKVHLQKEIW